MAIIEKKATIVMESKDIMKALKKRGIVQNKVNMNRFAKLCVMGNFTINNTEFYDKIPSDREDLILYGFTFEKEVQNE
jgi:hypothetical protein